MLVLTRRIGESLCLGADIVVTVINVQGCQVKIGISAPSDISVDREEIRRRKIADGSFPGHTFPRRAFP